MSYQADGTKLLLGKGKLYFAPDKDDGSAGDSIFLGDCPRFALVPNQTEIEAYGSTTAAAALLASDITQTKMGCAIDGREFNINQVAFAVFGKKVPYSQTADAVTAEVHDDVQQGEIVKLANFNVSTVVVKDDATPTPATFTVTTDYIVIDAVAGLIYIVPGGGIANGTNLRIDYAKALMTSVDAIGAGALERIRGKLTFVSDNARGRNFVLEAWRTTLKSSGEIGFISDQYGQWTLEGNFEDDRANHPNHPFFRLVYVS